MRKALTAAPDGESGDEQAGGVGCARRALPLGDQHAARRDRDPAQLRLGRASIVFGPIAGMSSLQILSALGRFHEYAGRAREAQPSARAHLRDAREHRVGAFRRLDRQDPAGGDDRALPGVEGRRARRGGRRRTRCPSSSSGDAARAPNGPGRREQARAQPRARRRRGCPRARRSRRGRRAGRCRRRETVARARAARLTAPQSSLRSANSGRAIAPMITISAMARALAARRTACRPRRCAPRRAGRLRSPRSVAPTTPTRNGSRPARRASRATSSGNAPAPQGWRAAAPGPAAPGPLTPPRPCRRAGRRSRDRRPAQEGDDLLHRLLAGERLGDLVDALLQRAFAVEQHLVGAPELVDRLVREAAALQADDIEAGERGAIAERHAEGNEVVLDAGQAADERMGADAHELVRPPRRRRGWRNRRSGNARPASRCWTG